MSLREDSLSVYPMFISGFTFIKPFSDEKPPYPDWRQLQTQSWQEEVFAEFLKGSDLTDLLLGDPEIDNEESGFTVLWSYAANLNEFEPCLVFLCIFKVKKPTHAECR